MLSIKLLSALPGAKSNKHKISSSGSLNGNLCDKPAELTFTLQGDESIIELSQSDPSSICLSKPFVFQPSSKIWYQLRLPPVSHWETELLWFLREREGALLTAGDLLWCVCSGAFRGTEALSSYSKQLHWAFGLFSHIHRQRKRLYNFLLLSLGLNTWSIFTYQPVWTAFGWFTMQISSR